jgi:uncharacterized protein (DUF1015 family)
MLPWASSIYAFRGSKNSGIRGLNALSDRVDDGSIAVAFFMYPTTMDDLMDIADAGAIMPPKSTWFEPKLRSGLFIHKLSD